MKLYGLTGGIGMGKTTAAQLLREQGACVVDTDDLAREVVQRGQPALAEVRAVFGSEVVGADGQLLRDELARIVFADQGSREKLEAILHPRIKELWQRQVAAWRDEGRPLAVVVIPLLFETKAESDFDAVMCVACTKATQQQRLLARGWSREQIDQRLAAQLPAEEKAARARFVLWTEGGLEVLAEQIARVLKV